MLSTQAAKELIKDYEFSYEAILDDEPLLKLFKSFCKLQRNEESMEFLDLVNQVKFKKSLRNKLLTSLEIYRDYIMPSSVKEININKKIRGNILNDLSLICNEYVKDTNVNMLDPEIMKLIKQFNLLNINQNNHQNKSKESDSDSNNNMEYVISIGLHQQYGGGSDNGGDQPLSGGGGSLGNVANSPNPLMGSVIGGNNNGANNVLNTSGNNLQVFTDNLLDNDNTENDLESVSTDSGSSSFSNLNSAFNNTLPSPNSPNLMSPSSSYSNTASSSSTGGGNAGVNNQQQQYKIINMLNKLFLTVEYEIHYNVKENLFISFIESDLFLNFLQQCEDPYKLLIKIANLKPHTYSHFVQILTEVTSHTITKSFLTLLKQELIYGNNHEWESIVNNEKSYSIFKSKEKYQFGNNNDDNEEKNDNSKDKQNNTVNQVCLWKTLYHFNFERERVMRALLSPELYSHYDPNYKKSARIRTIGKSKDGEEMACLLFKQICKLPFPLADRYMFYSTSLVHDKVDDSYLAVYKTFDNKINNNVDEDRKKVKALAFQMYVIKSKGPHTTVEHYMAIDFKGYVPDSTSQNFAKNRGKAYYEGINKLLTKQADKAVASSELTKDLYQTLLTNGDVDLTINPNN
ncbi:hypothetical protein ABK040_006303 [Willaertia magna]